ncbi:MAG: radical SAM protein [Bacteroidales bacterium]|nr:radical SAM protein [Bacteroidales bacterium]MDD4822728.1 radical SAM protein [Bacteroidales bacterium]
MISFGPVPSRRLGKSLGINNIPSGKVCSYSCVYCQVGLTKDYRTKQTELYKPNEIFVAVKKHLSLLKEKDMPDYLTFVSNGEPTLDLYLGDTIEKLKVLGIPIAVITNASLLFNSNVQDALCLADWVSVKVDSNDATIWELINRPDKSLDFERYRESVIDFSAKYTGKLMTETMLVSGINDSRNVVQQTAELLYQIQPDTAYLSIPIRPPALSTIKIPSETAMIEAHQILSEKNLQVEFLLGFEGTNTGYTGSILDDIVDICTVHPLREDTMMELLKKDNATPEILTSLIEQKYIKAVSYNSNTYYIRCFF